MAATVKPTPEADILNLRAPGLRPDAKAVSVPNTLGIFRSVFNRRRHRITTLFHNPMSPNSLSEWLALPLGQQLLQAEAELLRGILDDVFGLELLQLGGWGASRELLASARTRNQTIVAERASPAADVVAALDALPIQSASVDAVLLPHTLEFSEDPHAIVREADRVLTGEGQLIVMGFRPASLWGIRSASSRDGYPCGLQKMLSVRRVRDWLGLLGYEVVLQRQYLYSRPWAEDRAGTRRVRRRGLLNPLPASAWLLKARKHVYRMTPLRLRFGRERHTVLSPLAEPTRRNRP
jgi:SAM-dependent methyltransferase